MCPSTKGIDIRGANRVVGGMHVPQLELSLFFVKILPVLILYGIILYVRSLSALKVWIWLGL
jgi:hypothetical protein